MEYWGSQSISSDASAIFELIKNSRDLDSLVAGVCEYLQRAVPQDDTFTPSPLFNGKPEIGPEVPLIIKNDSQIVEINAKKMFDENLHYLVEIDYL